MTDVLPSAPWQETQANFSNAALPALTSPAAALPDAKERTNAAAAANGIDFNCFFTFFPLLQAGIVGGKIGHVLRGQALRNGFHGRKRTRAGGIILERSNNVFRVLPGDLGNVVNLWKAGFIALDAVAPDAHRHFGPCGLRVSFDDGVSCLIPRHCCTGHCRGQHYKGASKGASQLHDELALMKSYR